MSNKFSFLMISAMYENGGNTTHRFLDGHPELFVYPFESQIGTKYVNDHFTSMFPVKYRWPVFQLDSDSAGDYHSIIDEECKIRSRTPFVSKFRDWQFEFSDEERKSIFINLSKSKSRTRQSNVENFFRATFLAWKDYKKTGEERAYVGYSPIIAVDADKILSEGPDSHVLHVVRNPWSAYADTKKRAVPLSLHHYMLGWTLNQYHALLFKERYPDRLHIVRAEDVMDDPTKALTDALSAMQIDPKRLIATPTWNGQSLKEVYPWGTIRQATLEKNKATANELNEEEISLIKSYCSQYLDIFDYKNYVTK